MTQARIPPQPLSSLAKEIAHEIAVNVIGIIGMAVFFAAVGAPIILFEALR